VGGFSAPLAGLINVNRALYGTTSKGGRKRCHRTGNCGTVFAITTSGGETALYRFRRPPQCAFLPFCQSS